MADSPIAKLESRYRAVIDFTTAQLDSKMVPNNDVDGIGRKWGFTRQHVRRLVKRVRSGCSLLRKLGSGRPRSVNIPTIRSWLASLIIAAHGDISFSDIVSKMRAQWTVGSAGSVQRMLHSMGFKTVRQRVLPLLTQAHRQNRLEWARAVVAKEESPWLPSSRTVRAFVDEKWFFGHQLRKRIWIGPGVQRHDLCVGSKAHIPKVMFLAAVAQPIPEHGFSGRVGIYPITELKPATKTQRYFKKGEMKHHLINMDTACFINMMKSNVCCDLATQVGSFAEKIIVFMDSAGGHGGGKRSINNTTIAELTSWANQWPPELLSHVPLPRQPLPTWTFIAQPARSPDLNLLDLGAWCSINALVKDIRQQLADGASVEQIIRNVQQAWEDWNSEQKLGQLWETLQEVFKRIIACQGGNFYMMPHFR